MKRFRLIDHHVDVDHVIDQAKRTSILRERFFKLKEGLKHGEIWKVKEVVEFHRDSDIEGYRKIYFKLKDALNKDHPNTCELLLNLDHGLYKWSGYYQLQLNEKLEEIKAKLEEEPENEELLLDKGLVVDFINDIFIISEELKVLASSTEDSKAGIYMLISHINKKLEDLYDRMLGFSVQMDDM